MQGERDALLKLIQSLRHEYEAVQAAKMGQESELQGLKVQPCPAHDMLQHLCMPDHDICFLVCPGEPACNLCKMYQSWLFSQHPFGALLAKGTLL